MSMAVGLDLMFISKGCDVEASGRYCVLRWSYFCELQRRMWDSMTGCDSGAVFSLGCCGERARSFVGYVQVILDKTATPPRNAVQVA